MLFHDIKASTAKALPTILAELKKRGYKVVHMRSKSTFEPLPALTAELEAKRGQERGQERRRDAASRSSCRSTRRSARRARSPAEPAVTELAPDARERTHAGGTHATASGAHHAGGGCGGDAVEQPARRTRKHRARRAARGAAAQQPITNLGSAVSYRF